MFVCLCRLCACVLMLTSFLLFALAPLYQCILRSRFCACAFWPCTFVLAPFAFASLRLHLCTSVFALPSRLRLYACTLGTCAFELVPFALASFLRLCACAFCACDFTLCLCAFRFCACVLCLRLLRLRLAWCACALLLASRYVWLVGWLAGWLARGHTNCQADVSRRRALTQRSDAQTMVTVLGT